MPHIHTFTNSNDKYFGAKRARRFEKKFVECSNSFFLFFESLHLLVEFFSVVSLSVLQFVANKDV